MAADRSGPPPAAAPGHRRPKAATTGGDRRLIASGAGLTAGSLVAHLVAATSLASFALAILALAALAALVGRSVERLGDRLGSGATGVVQSALGNLPELFVSVFALRAGLRAVVQSTIVGSMLGNLLLVLGLAFVAGGWRHGTQRFHAESARNACVLLSLSVAIVVVPTLSAHLSIPVARHEGTLSDVAAGVLLAVFALAIPASLRAVEYAGVHHEARARTKPAGGSRRAGGGGGAPIPAPAGGDGPAVVWPAAWALASLAATSVAAAFVSDWFVTALSPSLVRLHVSQSFAGLVIVAIAGNAVENVVGIQLAMRNRMDYALSVILQSPIQVALFLFPFLVLISPALGGAGLTLVLPPLDLVALVVGVVVAVFVVFDGESTWLEGVVLVGLYVTVAAAFWWG